MISQTGEFTAEALSVALDDLFAEGNAGAMERERSAFDLATESSAKNSIVLFGAGQLGRMTLAGLRKVGIEPAAFIDNNQRLWNTTVQGVEALSPAEAARRYGDHATFIISIWGGAGTDRMSQRAEHLRRLGCRTVVSFQLLFWKYPELFLPHYGVDLPHKVHEQEDEVRQVARMWSDDASRREYLAQLRWRLLGEFDALPEPVDHAIYFPLDLCPLIDEEVFVDCGAFDGDTIRSFLKQPKSSFRRIYGFEPDPDNFKKMEADLSSRPERDAIRLRCAAVGRSVGTVTFSGGAGPSSRVGIGDLVIDCVTLDEALAEDEPTYIKMDIESAEIDALNGARWTIEKCAPVLAICSYHLQNHLWKIPLLMRSLNPSYNFFLRPHFLEGWDLVTYAIPDRRLRRYNSLSVL
jgi:FkbM family methyltransferase